jgi:hypothetical protein
MAGPIRQGRASRLSLALIGPYAIPLFAFFLPALVFQEQFIKKEKNVHN